MSVLLPGRNKLEQEKREREQNIAKEPTAAPAIGSVLLHAGLVGMVVLFTILHGLFKHDSWGENKLGGAISVQMTNALPLPADQKPNDNVLATDKPSEAPAPPPAPAPKAKPAPEPESKAIPIPEKTAKPKPEPKKQEKPKPEPKQPPKPVKEKPAPTPPKLQQKTPPQRTPVPTHNTQQKPVPDNHAQYGEQAASRMARATQANATQIGNASVSGGPSGFNYAYYVDALNRKMASNWNKGEVDPRTPRGTRAFLVFTIGRDGTLTNIQIDKTSGSSTLDRSCLRAAQRVDTFGPLPAGYHGSSVNVEYYCEY